MDLRRFKSSSVSVLGSCTCQREPRSVNVPLSDSMKSVNILALIKYLISRLWTPRSLLLLLRNRKENFMKFNQFYKISVAVCAFHIGMTDWVTWLKTFFRLTIENVSFRQQSETFKNWLTMARDKKHLKEWRTVLTTAWNYCLRELCYYCAKMSKFFEIKNVQC